MQNFDSQAVSSHVTNSNVHNRGRRMMSRRNQRAINLLMQLNPATETPSCIVCCSAPSCCPLCSICPCCMDADYILLKREASKYIYIRENSLEWNAPRVIMKHGTCFGIDPCIYDIQDHVQVLYFDDPMFDRITDQTRTCNECRTCICGGKGERIQIDSPCCFNLCQRAACPCPCVPICCPNYICPCALRHEIYVEDAQKGKYEISRTLAAARANALYATNSPPVGAKPASEVANPSTSI